MREWPEGLRPSAKKDGSLANASGWDGRDGTLTRFRYGGDGEEGGGGGEEVDEDEDEKAVVGEDEEDHF